MLTYCGVADALMGISDSATVHVTRVGIDADIALPSYICTLTFISSVNYIIFHLLAQLQTCHNKDGRSKRKSRQEKQEIYNVKEENVLTSWEICR